MPRARTTAPTTDVAVVLYLGRILARFRPCLAHVPLGFGIGKSASVPLQNHNPADRDLLRKCICFASRCSSRTFLLRGSKLNLHIRFNGYFPHLAAGERIRSIGRQAIPIGATAWLGFLGSCLATLLAHACLSVNSFRWRGQMSRTQLPNYASPWCQVCLALSLGGCSPTV